MEDNKPIRPIVVAPTYNNARTLRGVIERACALGWPVLVVDDGSTDETAGVLGQIPNIRVETHAVNRGKAAALQTGFRAAEVAGFTHAVTVDTDGQLDPEQIPALIARAEQEPDALVLGCRDDAARDYPARSRIGRRISNLLVYLECGVRVDDSQCGLRVYPLELANNITCRANRFGYETEIITRTAWAKFAVIEVPVRCRYFPPADRVSHFRPWVDSFRSVRMNTWLLVRALCPWPHAKYRAGGSEERVSWRDYLDWVNPMRAWQQLRAGDIGRMELSLGIALGIFIANLPLYGFQTLIAIYTARRLHLHPVPIVAGSQISTPPIGPAMVAGAITIGHLLLHGALPHWSEFNFARLGVMSVMGPLLLEWVIGSVLLGLAMGASGFFVAMALCKTIQTRASAPAGA